MALASSSLVLRQVVQVRLMTVQAPPVSNPVWPEKLKVGRSQILQEHTIPWAPTSLIPNQARTLAALLILPDLTLLTLPIVLILALILILMDAKVLAQVRPGQALVWPATVSRIGLFKGKFSYYAPLVSLEL